MIPVNAAVGSQDLRLERQIRRPAARSGDALHRLLERPCRTERDWSLGWNSPPRREYAHRDGPPIAEPRQRPGSAARTGPVRQTAERGSPPAAGRPGRPITCQRSR